LSTVPTAKNIQSPLLSPLSGVVSVGECDQYLCRKKTSASSADGDGVFLLSATL
jgi:hypothetical protein